MPHGSDDRFKLVLTPGTVAVQIEFDSIDGLNDVLDTLECHRYCRGETLARTGKIVTFEAPGYAHNANVRHAVINALRQNRRPDGKINLRRSTQASVQFIIPPSTEEYQRVERALKELSERAALAFPNDRQIDMQLNCPLPLDYERKLRRVVTKALDGK